jgi:excisionase family DNA binding protein
MSSSPAPELLTVAEVASLFAVTPKTVASWARAGLLGPVVRTLGGHRRFHRDQVFARLFANTSPRISPAGG